MHALALIAILSSGCVLDRTGTKLRLVATDGRRLAVANARGAVVDVTGVVATGDVAVILPSVTSMRFSPTCTVLPLRLAALTMDKTSERVTGSIPVAGSSRKTMGGSPTRETATESLRLLPPLRVPARRSRNSRTGAAREKRERAFCNVPTRRTAPA